MAAAGAAHVDIQTLNDQRMEPMRTFLEFFAGGGMARAGLGSEWTCLFANDFDQKKAASYTANWGSEHLRLGDVGALTTSDLPVEADLAWASFPCQDLSLAGAGAGLDGNRSGTFWPFWGLMKALVEEDRAPRLIVLENVCGALSSHAGKDFVAICDALSNSGYRFGAVVINAIHFLPQSRPRLFIIGVRNSTPIPRFLLAGGPLGEWHTPSLVEAHAKLSGQSQDAWLWWQLPAPPSRASTFAEMVEDSPHGVAWHSDEETKKLLAMMTQHNLAKVEAAKKSGRRTVGTIYKRTRVEGQTGGKIQRAEIRFDDVAGCLRTPAGGSSRQSIMVIKGDHVRSRLISAREAARLMGLSDNYILPAKYNDAYHLAGDGVAVPVVRFLAKYILEPILVAVETAERKAA